MPRRHRPGPDPLEARLEEAQLLRLMDQLQALRRLVLAVHLLDRPGHQVDVDLGMDAARDDGPHDPG